MRCGGGVNASDPVLQAAVGLPRQKYLVGVSGGRDSTALLHALVEAGHRRLVVCHLDHELRGKASRADAAFVRRLAGKLGLECRSGRADVAGLAAAGRISTEAAARHARHVFFEECSVLERCPRLVLAHHMEDQAETVLFNLLRGSGLVGASGMDACSTLYIPGFRRPLGVWRPFLPVRGEEIAAWCRARKLKWREDASNQTAEFTRNRLRLEALPLLSGIMDRDVAPILHRFAALAAEEDAALEAIAALRLQECLRENDTLCAAPLLSEPLALQRRVVRQWLRSHSLPDPGSAATAAVCVLLSPAGPKGANLPGGAMVRRTRGVLWVVKSGAPE